MSAHAADILEQMEPNRGYEPSELKGFIPGLSAEGLREVMHELWIARQVERFGFSGWRRVRSTRGAEGADRTLSEPRLVKPEELFDHDSFGELFK